ncbi:unnamed protein product [Ceratitis capitata]|uniref:(Mediterranean fruit fly) hypothetical protein n=1 Tax=Ceratitis capitata TaxID=7213 RepID=A0A811USQ5_CERCA|nr:unnamed protein product [Ceratitis capitata]
MSITTANMDEAAAVPANFARNQRISPAHSVNSVGSQGLRRRTELLQEQSEILRHRKALLREEYSFLDRIDAVGFDDELDESQHAMPGASAAMRVSALNTTQTLQLPPNLVAPVNSVPPTTTVINNGSSLPDNIPLRTSTVHTYHSVAIGPNTVT